MTSVSVICPTYQRHEQLRDMVGHYCAQKFGGSMQLLILDDSPEPAEFLSASQYLDRGVLYFHRPEHRMPVGTKLNTLMYMARGDVMMRFDDDDYYAPNYVERMLNLLGDNDILTLSAWFAYSSKHDIFCYWETDVLWPTHYVLSPWDPELRTVSTEGWQLPNFANGYGFASAWRREVAARVQFPDVNHGEDGQFFEGAVEAGFRPTHAADTEGLVLHIIHESNSSRMFPQYILPSFTLPKYFPGYTDPTDIQR